MAKCEMGSCRNMAKLKISTSGGSNSILTCYKDSIRYLRMQIQQINDYDFGIYVQRAPKEDPKPMKIGRRHRPGRQHEEEVDDEWRDL